MSIGLEVTGAWHHIAIAIKFRGMTPRDGDLRLQSMTLAAHCAALQTVAAVCSAECCLAVDLAGDEGEEGEALIANALAAGVSQLALMITPLTLEALALEEQTATSPRPQPQLSERHPAPLP